MKHQYPIGRFNAKESYSQNELNQNVKTLKKFPSKLNSLVETFSEEDLKRTYRTGGWTAKQVIHHISDSHMNMLTRLKWTLTEEQPSIKAYFEDRWAHLADYELPISTSLNLLEAIHSKVVAIFESLDAQDWQKGYVHPEDGKLYTLATVSALYAWHSEHHYAHLELCKV